MEEERAGMKEGRWRKRRRRGRGRWRAPNCTSKCARVCCRNFARARVIKSARRRGLRRRARLQGVPERRRRRGREGQTEMRRGEAGKRREGEVEEGRREEEERRR